MAGTDSDALGATGTWAYTLMVNPVTVSQAAPSTGTVSTTKSSTSPTNSRPVGRTGRSATPPRQPISHLSVSAAGVLSTTSTLAAGSYAVSGTDSDIDGDRGTWSYDLSVQPAAISQDSPTAGSTSTSGSAIFAGQLATNGQSDHGQLFHHVTECRCCGLCLRRDHDGWHPPSWLLRRLGHRQRCQRRHRHMELHALGQCGRDQPGRTDHGERLDVESSPPTSTFARPIPPPIRRFLPTPRLAHLHQQYPYHLNSSQLLAQNKPKKN